MRDDHPLLDEIADQYRLLQRGLGPGEIAELTVQSGSMLPLLPVGSSIAVAPIEGSRCRVGDVVVFRRRDRLVVHRLIFGWGHGPGGRFLERGDGFSPTGLVRSDAILGRVIAVRTTAGELRRLDDPDEGWRGQRAARRSLARALRSLASDTVQRGRRWLTRGTTDSG